MKSVLGVASLAVVVVAAGLEGSPVAPAAERVDASGVVLFVEALGGAAHVVQVGADGTRRERLLTLTRKKIGAVAF